MILQKNNYQNLIIAINSIMPDLIVDLINLIIEAGAINLTETVTVRSDIDHVLMTLEWTQNDLTYSFHITVAPPLPQVNFSTTSIQAQIRVPYNVAYNVSILVPSCGQYNVTAFSSE